VVAKSQLKKITKLYVREQHKDQAAAVKEKEDAESREKNMEEAKKARRKTLFPPLFYVWFYCIYD